MQLLLAAIVLIATAAQVEAQVSDDERARTHFESGRSYYEQARYDDSAREFKEAFELSNRPALLLNLSQAYERGLHFAEAIAEIQRYLQLVPDAPDRKTLEERVTRLQELQARVAQPTAATAPAAAPSQAPAEAPAATQSTPAPATATPPPATTEDQDSGLFVPGIVLVGSGGAVLIGSLITGLMAHGKHSDLEEQCGAGPCPASAQGDIDSGETLALVSTVLMGVGIVAAGIGAVLLVLDQTHDAEAPAHTEAGDVQLAAGPTPFGLAAHVTF